jgi:uncharacterized protein (TIGR04255 family)
MLVCGCRLQPGEGAVVTTREVYPRAPLRLVSLELRFPTTTRMLTRPLWDGLESALSGEFPDVVSFPSDPDAHIPSGPDEPVLRRMSEQLKRAVTLYAGALTIELADYRGYEELEALVEKTLSAFKGTFDVPMRYTRVGLRYINEVRAELMSIPEDEWQISKSWMPYINNELLGDIGAPPAGLCAFASRKSAFFHSTTGREHITLDYGIHHEGFVDPSDVLILDGDSGPCFVLDLDAFQGGTSNKPAASGDGQLVKAIGRLHDIVESTFQWSVTDQAREVFRAPAHRSPDQGSLAHVSDS